MHDAPIIQLQHFVALKLREFNRAPHCVAVFFVNGMEEFI